MEKQRFYRDEVRALVCRVLQLKEDTSWDIIRNRHKRLSDKYAKSNPTLSKAHNRLHSRACHNQTGYYKLRNEFHKRNLDV